MIFVRYIVFLRDLCAIPVPKNLFRIAAENPPHQTSRLYKSSAIIQVEIGKFR